MSARIARLAMVCAALWSCAAAAQGDWSGVSAAMGRPGTEQPGGVMRFSFPRSDLRVTLDGVAVRPALALGSWVAFRRASGGAMAMGDLVLAENEVAPVISRLQQGGVDASAVHNHLLREQPRVMYVHLEAHGDPVRIAQTVHAALALTRTPMAAPPAASASPAIALDTAAVARALGRSGRVNGGVLQVSVPRAEAVVMHGDTVPPAMGVATAINFQPTGGGRAAATGDFVMTAGEVAGVLRALRDNGIEVTALHSHMTGEEPRLYFAHFWVNDDAVKIARGLNAALAGMKVEKEVLSAKSQVPSELRLRTWDLGLGT
ncbi:DUF1259 domain-containing protein [Longimicrobium sp.]|uniref:DUF1259 domain-containing protein n=1 Tax=Longimicrobium sp. TaxID=2029185 RepID=UPI002CF9DC77|nr:DUF1259 domain-containing protein [Longimicrobium sp.]HSU12710.1 DUF1259 domain-containing protein [Longimicrobium sp.]